jgi:hypothetical protein
MPAGTRHLALQWGCWNVRTLHSQLAISGTGEVTLEGEEPQKINDLCSELTSFGISLCAISEHRWAGSGTFKVDDNWTLIFSGTQDDEAKGRNGVGFLLNNDMIAAWRKAGESCIFHSSRLLQIRLWIRGRYISLLSCYAPTFTSGDSATNVFYSELGGLLDHIPGRDELFLFGDFNARVGTANVAADEVSDVVGNFGLPDCNDNGLKLKQFCWSRCKERLRIMTTCFPHKHYGTWSHPSSQRWFQIDHCITSRRTSGLVMDAKVMPGYIHDTDHRFVKVSVRIPPKTCLGRYYKAPCQIPENNRIQRLNVARLKDPSVVSDFNSLLTEIVAEGLTDNNYSLFGHALRRAAACHLGPVPSGYLPLWKIDNQDRLAELSALKRRAMGDSLAGSRTPEYKAACRFVKTETRKLINQWWTDKSSAIQQAIDNKDPNYQFAGYRELRRVLAHGKKPPSRLKDANGQLLLTKPERIRRWGEYFQSLLNVPSVVQPSELDVISEKIPNFSLDSPPTFSETLAALSKLKKGKACGPDGIEAEVLMALNLNNVRIFHEFITRVWTGAQTMPPEWLDSYTVPLPKKGDLSCCSRWRGVMLASIPGKLFARILQARLYDYSETAGLLPETQCGFRRNRGTMDMIFLSSYCYGSCCIQEPPISCFVH